MLCSLKIPEGMSEKNVSLWISLMDHLYWIAGSVLGGMIGQFIKFDTTGIDFSMTALFVVIVINQWLDNKEHRPALIGAVLGSLCLILFGPDKFMLPALTFTALILLGVKKRWNMQ